MANIDQYNSYPGETVMIYRNDLLCPVPGVEVWDSLRTKYVYFASLPENTRKQIRMASTYNYAASTFCQHSPKATCPSGLCLGFY